MSGLDSQSDWRELDSTDAPEQPGSGSDGIEILSDIADEQDAAQGQPVESSGDAGDSSGGLSIPERHRVQPRPESSDALDREDAAVSPGSGFDGIEILSDIADEQDAAQGQPVESSGDAADSSGGLSIPERHRVVPSVESGHSPEGTYSFDADSYGQGGSIPPEMVPEDTFVLRTASTEFVSPERAQVPPSDRAVPVTELLPQDPERADVRGFPSEQAEQRFPSEQAEQRKEHWYYQGERNDRGYTGTCSLTSTAAVLSDLTGEEVTENRVVNLAADNGWCNTDSPEPTTDSPEPTRLGATSQFDVWLINRELGRELGTDPLIVQHRDLESLASYVDSGDGVLATVNSAEYWPSDPIQQRNLSLIDDNNLGEAGPDHMVWVTGVSRDPENRAVTGFYINDTGLPDGAGLFLSNSEMRRAWEKPGGQLVVVSRGDQT